jgi:putative ABC transport system ATP-binding protein
LLPRMNALQNVLMPTMYFDHHPNRDERAVKLLEQVGLGKRFKHKPAELSGGEKQRVAIARSLINDPDIILADEPTGNLDSKSGQEVMQILKELNEQGKTIIVITHDLEIAKICKRLVNIRDGRLEGGNHVR